MVAALAGVAAPSRGEAKRAPRDPLDADSLRAVPVNRFDWESPDPADPTLAPEELSGLVWIEGERYLAIGDAHAVVHSLTIHADATGEIRSATFGAPLALRDSLGSRIPEPALAKDREGIAYDPARNEVWLANEQTGLDPRWPSIERHSMTDGKMTGAVRVDMDPALAPFQHARPNRSFESMTRAPDGSAYWTVNEDALTIDGPAASDTAGAVVRLLELSPGMKPVAQYPYPLDAFSGPIRTPSIVAGREISGVSELVALPGRRLLALERSFGGARGGNASLRNRLYLVDFSGATDVSGGEFREGLAGKRYVAAKKVLLWESEWGLTNSNFEGMALGPALPDGSRLLVLVADNNGGSAQALFTLRLSAR
ncbi:MAG: esterase-like activity of phytase family protein [Bacteroidota bacterium]